MPQTGALGIDVGTNGGNWLFKQQDLLLGPVPLKQLIELLYAGQVDGETLVSPHGDGAPQFKRLAEVDLFKVHLAKAQAKHRVEAQSQKLQVTERRSRTAKIVGVGIVGILLVLGGGKVAWWLAIHRPWEKQLQLPEPVIADDDELPTIKLASARQPDELVYPDTLPGKPTTPGQAAQQKPGATQQKPVMLAQKPKETGKPSPSEKKPAGATDDVMQVQNWDQGAINAVIKDKKKTLHGCLSSEAQRQKPGWSARVPIEFTIGNDGRVVKLWIDNPDYKAADTELYKCMFAELRKWQFPKYDGEQANVSLAFNVGAK